MANNQRPPQRPQSPPPARPQESRPPAGDDGWRGPTASELQPPKRMEPHLLYAEDLITWYGAERAAKGVHLEIINVRGGTVQIEPGKKDRKKSIMLKLGDGQKILEKEYGCNRTAVKVLTGLFSDRVVEWVGWVTMFTTLVKDNINGGMVQAIRIKNARPNLAPTFPYAANIAKRLAAAKASRNAPAVPEMPDVEMLPPPQLPEESQAATPPAVEMTAEERAEVEARERASMELAQLYTEEVEVEGDDDE